MFRNDSDRSVKEVCIGLENSFQLMQTLFSELRRSTGASVISAASAYENAVEGDQWQNGVFIYCLKRGLKDRKEDTNKDEGQLNKICIAKRQIFGMPIAGSPFSLKLSPGINEKRNSCLLTL